MSILTLLLPGADSGQQATTTAVASVWVAPNASASVGGVTRTTTMVDAHWVAPNATATNTITVTATAADAHWVAPNASASVGAVTRSSQMVDAHWEVLNATSTKGAVTRTTMAVDAHWVAPSATAANTITVAATMADAHWVAPSATSTKGAVTRTTTPVDAHWATASATATPGPRTVAVDQNGTGSAWWKSIAASVVIGALTATATMAGANWVVPSATAGEGGSRDLTLPFLAATSACYTPAIPKVVLEVREDSTLRMTRDLSLLDALTTYELAFTSEEWDAITDLAVLRASAIANGTTVELGWLRIGMPASGSTQVLTLPTLASQEALYAPEMAHAGAGLQTLTLPTIASLEQLYAPELPYYTLTFSSGGATVFEKPISLQATHVTEAIVFSPEEWAAVSDWGVLAVSATGRRAQVEISWIRLALPDAAPSNDLVMPFLASGAQLFAPAVGLTVLEMPHLASTTVLHAPTIPQDGAYVQLFEGEIVRATWQLGVTADWATTPLTLTQSQWESIGDWSTVRVAPVANGEQLQVSWMRFVAPGQAPLALPNLATTVQLFAPTVEHGGTVMMAPIASTTVLYPPTLSTSSVTIDATAAQAVWTAPDAVAGQRALRDTTAVCSTWVVPAASTASTITVGALPAFASWVVRMGIVPPPTRILYVSHQGRRITISAEDRRIDIGPETRIVIVEEDTP